MILNRAEVRVRHFQKNFQDYKNPRVFLFTSLRSYSVPAHPGATLYAV